MGRPVGTGFTCSLRNNFIKFVSIGGRSGIRRAVSVPPSSSPPLPSASLTVVVPSLGLVVVLSGLLLLLGLDGDHGLHPEC